MSNPLRLEYINLLPWKRTNVRDEELGLDDENLSESGSHCNVHPTRSGSCGSNFSLNEGDLLFLGFSPEDGHQHNVGTGTDGHEPDALLRGSMNQTLMMAIEEKDVRKAEFLLRNGADPNCSFGMNKTTPLHLAAAQGMTEAVRLLIQHGADVRTVDSRGVSALHIAAGIGDAQMVQQLIAAGADVSLQDLARETGAGSECPLHRAAMAGNLETLKKLVDSGADVNCRDSRGRTPIHCAAQRGAAGCLQTLLDSGADPNAQDKMGASALLLLGGSFLMRGHRRASGYSDSVDILVRGGAKVNVRDPDTDVTPLHQAVTLGRLEPVRVLLTAGASLHAQDREGVTPLHVCSLKGQSSILRLLLAHPSGKEGVNMADSKGRTALHKAAYRGSQDCINLLLKAGADLGAKTRSGVSAATLILRLPKGPKIVSDRLDESISTNSVDPNEYACRLKFDYSVLLSKSKFQQMGVVEDILDERRERRTEDLIQHPLIESFLFLKWRKIRLLFFSTVIFYLILVAGVTAYVLSAVSIEKTISPIPSVNNDTLAAIVVEDPVMVFNLQQSLSVIILIIIFQEVIQFASLHILYFREAESYIKLGALVTSTIVIFSPPPWEGWVHHIAAWAVLFGWTELTLMLGRLPNFGVYALMFYSVAQHLVKFIFVFFFFLAGFSFSFHVMFMDHKAAFQSPWTAILRTLAMMLGDVNYDEYLTEGNSNLNGTAHVIYFCFLILVALILMNLLIGLAVNDIQGLQKEGRVKRLRKQAQFIVYLEDIASNRFLKMILRERITAKFNEWINQAPIFIINPASVRRPRIQLPSSIVEHALAVAQEDRIPADRISNRDTYNLVHDCIASIDLLRQRIESLENGLVSSSSADVLPTSSSALQPDDDPQVDGQRDDDDQGSDETAELEDSEEGNPEGEDQVDGFVIQRNRRSMRKPSRTLRSELEDIKRMLNALCIQSKTQN